MSERLDVLRLGYRRGRDPRITTHLALVSRAMGANGFFLAGDEDKEMSFFKRDNGNHHSRNADMSSPNVGNDRRNENNRALFRQRRAQSQQE